MAGDINDLKLAVQTKDFFRAHNFDKVLMKNYTVLVSLPDSDNPNYIELIDENNNKTIYSSLNNNIKETDSLHDYCTYCPNADFMVRFKKH